MKRFVQSCGVDGMFNLNKNVRMVINIFLSLRYGKTLKRRRGNKKRLLRPRKGVRQCSVKAGDEVLIGEPKKKVKKGNCLQDLHQGPFTLTSLTEKGVAMSGKIQKINVSQLRPYFRTQGIVIILLGDIAIINMTLDNDD